MNEPNVDRQAWGALPGCWTEAARALAEIGVFGIDVRPWNWLELDAEEAALVWELLASFVEYLNRRYAVDLATRVPPCWAEHGAVVEELTTLAFAHWQAFSSEHASIGGAQYWHSYSLPGFYERLGRWLKGTRTYCDVGRHRDPERHAYVDQEHWNARVRAIAETDLSLRRRVVERGAQRTMEVPFASHREGR